MKKLAKELINNGLNPRLLWCGFMSPCQIKQKLEEFLPYCKIIQKEVTDDYLLMDLDFHDFIISIKFEFKTSEDNIHFIQKIVYCE